MAKTSPEPEEAKTEKVKDDRVEVFIPKGQANEDPNLFVCVNGKNYLLPKGKKSLVPPEVAEEIRRANEAQETMDAHMDELLEASR